MDGTPARGSAGDAYATLSAIIRDQVRAAWTAVDEGLEAVSVERLRRITLAGAGEAFLAADAARWTCARHTALPTEALEALDLALYGVDMLSTGTLVVALVAADQAGDGGMAARRAERRGATVLTVMEQAPGRSMPVGQRAAARAGVVRSPYLSLLTAGYVVTAALARRLGMLSEGRAAELLDEIVWIADQVEQTMKGEDEVLRDLAADLATGDAVALYGAGPHHANALLSAGCLREQSGLPAEARRLHGAPSDGTAASSGARAGRSMLLAPRGRSLERAAVIGAMQQRAGTPCVVLTDDDVARWRPMASRIVSVPAGASEHFSPLLFGAMLVRLCALVAEARRGSDADGAAGE